MKLITKIIKNVHILIIDVLDMISMIMEKFILWKIRQILDFFLFSILSILKNIIVN